MRVAIRTGSTFGQALVNFDRPGELVGDHSGLSIVKRLLAMFRDDAVLIVDEVSKMSWFDKFWISPLAQIDVNDTVIINMDVVDSMALYRSMAKHWRLHPKIVNLVWWNTSEWTDSVMRQELALSTALFPTFCNSSRTESEIRALHRRYLTPTHVAAADVQHQNLGFPMPDLGPAVPDEEPPVVLYPAMWLFARKNPQQFVDVVASVAARVPIRVEMRLHPKAFPHPVIEALNAQPWADVDYLAPKDEYWGLLQRTTAFLATAQDESYGLQYLEALYAGVIGVFPRRPWASTILPPGYPFLYENLAQAEQMLHLAVTKPDDCRLMMYKAFGGDPIRWLRQNHHEEDFDSELEVFLETRFPELIKEETDA